MWERANYEGSGSAVRNIRNNPESEYTLTMPAADISHIVFNYVGTDIVLY